MAVKSQLAVYSIPSPRRTRGRHMDVPGFEERGKPGPSNFKAPRHWIPAFAGTTKTSIGLASVSPNCVQLRLNASQVPGKGGLGWGEATSPRIQVVRQAQATPPQPSPAQAGEGAHLGRKFSPRHRLAHAIDFVCAAMRKNLRGWQHDRDVRVPLSCEKSRA